MVHSLVRNAFGLLLMVRCWTEFLDARFGLALSALITGSIVMLLGPLVIFARVRFSRRLLATIVWLHLFFASAILSWLMNDLGLYRGALEQIYKYATYIAVIFVAATVIRTQRHVKQLILYLALGMIPSMAFAVYQGITGTGLEEGGGRSLVRAYGLATHPVLFGTQIVLVLSLVWAACAATLRCNNVQRTITLLFLLLAIPALYFTYARTAWIMLAVIAVFTALKHGGGYVKATALAGTGFIGVLFVSSERFYELGSLWAFFRDPANFWGVHLAFDSSMHWRLFHWYSLIATASQSPVFGFGPGMAISLSDYGLPAHSVAVDVYIEQGLVGLLAFLGVAISVYLLCRTRDIPAQNRLTGAPRTIMNATLLAALLAGTFSISLLNQSVNMMLLVILIVLREKLDRLFLPLPVPTRDFPDGLREARP